MYHLYIMQQELLQVQNVDEKLAEKMENQLQQLVALYQTKGGNLGY